MKKSLFFVSAIVFFIVFIGMVHAEGLYTVHLGDLPSRELAGKKAQQAGFINDLWLRKTGNGYSLCAGIFPEKNIAEKMRLALVEEGIKGQVIPASVMPKRDEWIATSHALRLRELGYTRPVLISGATPYRAFHFPWQSSLDIKKTNLTLRLRASQFLRPESSITISVEGIPLLSLPALDLQKDSVLTLDLKALSDIEIGPTLDVAISGTLSAYEDRCLDLVSNNLWLLVSPESAMHTVRRWPPESPAAFMADPTAQFNLSQVSRTREAIDALIRITGLIGGRSGSIQSRIHFTPYSLHHGNIFIGNFKSDVQVLGSNIYVTPAGARLLASTWRPILLSREIRISRIGTETKEIKTTLSFDDLGIPQKTARGRGDLLFYIDLSPLDLGGWPEKLICTLVYAHTPVGQQERAFLRIRLNGILVDSREIKGKGKRQDITFSIPTHYFKEKNSLEFAFSYYLNRGDCLGSYPDFEVALFNDSFFTVTGYNPRPPITLSTFSALAQGHGTLIMDSLEPEQYRAAARLVEILGFQQHRAPDITLGSFPFPQAEPPDYALLITGGKLEKELDPVLKISPHFIIKNPLADTVLLDITTQEPVTALQSFYDKSLSIPLLVFSQRRAAKFPEKSITEIFSTHPRANVAVFHNDQWQAMEVGKKFRVLYPDSKGISYYWVRYRLIIFIVMGALLLAFLLYTYHRLAKEK